MNRCLDLAQQVDQWQTATAILGFLLLVAIILLIAIGAAFASDHAKLSEKADAYDRMLQMDSLRGQTRSAYQQVVSAHAHESQRIVTEARK